MPADHEPGAAQGDDSPTAALDKHACPACGAKAEWQPGRQVLACAFCGTVSPAAVDLETGRIREHDLTQALRELPEDRRGWQSDRRAVRCTSCRAVSVFEAGRVGQNCDFCGSPALVAYDEIRSPIRPESVLPFKIPETRVRDDVRRWYASKWLAPRVFQRRAMVERIRGIYVPYWTFDAQVHCPWTAEAGHYYYTTESFRDAQGRSQTRQVRHVRWVPASGVVDHFFDDQPVPASHGLDHELLRQVEPFPTQELVPYDTAFLSGFVVEHYQVVLLEAAEQSRRDMDERLRGLCAAQVPGDTQRNLQIDPQYSGQTFKHVLVPVWFLTYSYGGKLWPLVANGYTGRIAGRYPKSPWKILALALLAALAVGALVLFGSR